MLYWKIKNIVAYLAFISCFLVVETHAQSRIKVQDPALAKVLCEQFSELMTSGCDSLDLDKAALMSPLSSSTDLNANNLGITYADELKYLTELKRIFIRDNDLTDFPDPNNFKNLFQLDITNNNLTVAPRINFDNNGSFEMIQLTGNDIRKFPSWSDTTNDVMRFVNISWNRLKVLPVLDSLTNVRTLRVHRNELPFSELLKIKNIKWYDSLDDISRLFPQHNFNVSGDTSIAFNEDLLLDVEDKTPGNSYYLVSSNDTIAQNTDGIFTISKELMGKDTAQFVVFIRNIGFTASEEFLQSDTFSVVITYPKPEKEDEFLKFSPNGDGVDDYLYLEGSGDFSIYSAAGIELKSGSLPYNWSGQKVDGNYIVPGIYYLKTDKGNQKILALY